MWFGGDGVWVPAAVDEELFVLPAQSSCVFTYSGMRYSEQLGNGPRRIKFSWQTSSTWGIFAST